MLINLHAYVALGMRTVFLKMQGLCLRLKKTLLCVILILKKAH
jgi:hypothetical protein